MREGRGNQRGEFFQQFVRFEHEVGRAVAQGLAQREGDAAVGQFRQAVGGERRAGEVPAQPLETRAIARGDADTGVDVEAGDLGAKARLDERERRVGRVPHAHHAAAAAAARGDDALHRGAGHGRKHRLALGEWVVGWLAVGRGERLAAARAESLDAPGDIQGDGRDLVGAGRGEGEELGRAVLAHDPHPVGHEAVVVRVERR